MKKNRVMNLESTKKLIEIYKNIKVRDIEDTFKILDTTENVYDHLRITGYHLRFTGIGSIRTCILCINLVNQKICRPFPLHRVPNCNFCIHYFAFYAYSNGMINDEVVKEYKIDVIPFCQQHSSFYNLHRKKTPISIVRAYHKRAQYLEYILRLYNKNKTTKR